MAHPLRGLYHLALASLAAVGFTGPALGGPTLPPTDSATESAEVAVPNTRRMEFVSKVNGHRYSIMVALPFTPAPAKGYDVLYVLDGYWYFASAAEVVRLGTLTLSGVVVVGIGYPDDPGYAQSVLAERGPVSPSIANLPPSRIAPFYEREYDLTLPASDSALVEQSVKGEPRPKSENVGGLDNFLKVIETEVKPRVATLGPIDTANQAFFGHSLGGLAVLHALFVEPNAFRTFIIASPSIFWGNNAVLADEARFAAAIRSGKVSPRVLVTMGSQEETPPKALPANSGIRLVDLEEAYLHKWRMVESGADLVKRLKALHAAPGYLVVNYAVFDKVGHTMAAWSALAGGISFAFDDVNP